MKLLTELLDKPLKYKITNLDREGESVASFKLSGNQYDITLDWDDIQLDRYLRDYAEEEPEKANPIIEDVGKHKKYHLYFDMEGGTEMTYRGEAVKVLSTVVKASIDLVNRVNPKVVYFTSDDESKSRTMVYKRFLRRYNYQDLYQFRNTHGEDVFIVIL